MWDCESADIWNGIEHVDASGGSQSEQGGCGKDSIRSLGADLSARDEQQRQSQTHVVAGQRKDRLGLFQGSSAISPFA